MSYEAILSSLNEVLAPIDQEVLESTKTWAAERAQAVRDFWKSDEAKKLSRDSFGLYDRLFAIAGGKFWYNLFNGRNDAMIADAVVKHCRMTAEARNEKIAAKLIKAEINEVLSSEFARTNDGFDGTFVVETSKGRKTITINTIVAGGYNIQCRHVRVLVKVSK